jgi:hypothetical protein
VIQKICSCFLFLVSWFFRVVSSFLLFFFRVLVNGLELKGRQVVCCEMEGGNQMKTSLDWAPKADAPVVCSFPLLP